MDPRWELAERVGTGCQHAPREVQRGSLGPPGKLLHPTVERNQILPPCSRGEAGVGCDQGEDSASTARARRRKGGDMGSPGTPGHKGRIPQNATEPQVRGDLKDPPSNL